ncbi:efflux transporter periplasmic adaptor subunit, partial [Vibrio harveyi]
IAKQDGSTGNDLLPNVNPNFQWIRLAQRIPIKVKLDELPDDLQLRVGMTASIKIIK